MDKTDYQLINYKKNISLKTSTLKQKQKNITRFILFFAFAVFGLYSVQAQIQNNGAIYIGDLSELYLKSGTFTFGLGSTTATSRTTTNYGKLQLASGVTTSGAVSGAGLFTDGCVSTKSSVYFILPTGQTTTYAPIGITNATVSLGAAAAYYVNAPTTVGSTLASTISALPPTGYWVVKGDNVTLTMIWSSSISTLSNSIVNLTIAGFNTTTNTWESIDSGTPTGSLTSGTLATSNAITLNNYSAFTLAKKGFTCAELVSSSGLTRTWDGSAWDTAPTLADAAVLSGAYPSTAGSFVCNSLAVNAAITLIDGQTIEVVNGISGTGVITISSQASVLQRNDLSTITPTIVLTKSTRDGMYPLDFVFMGSPLSIDSFSQLAGAKAYNVINTLATGVAGAFDEMYKYISGDITSAGGWKPLTTTSPGTGFDMRIKLQAPFQTPTIQNTTSHINLTFTGTTNNGAVIVPVANNLANPTHARNHNLLANPYPSAIDADKFLEYNTNLDGVVYVWKAQTPNSGAALYTSSDYIAYTRAGSTAELGTTSFTGKIATGQGFMVKALTSSGTGTAFFNNCMRISGNNDQFMRTNSDATVDRYKLNMTGGNGVGNQILVAYMPQASLAYDRMYDAELNSVSTTQVYSILEGSHTQLAINARPAFENSDVVNLGVSKSGTAIENFSIAISEKEGVFATGAVLVYLHDTVLNMYHNLANGPYTFNTSSPEMNSRFKIVYQDSTLNNADFESNNVFAKISNEIFKIVSSLPMTDVSVYDLSGRLVMNIKVNNQNEIINAFPFAEGIYIVKIKLENGIIATQKLSNKK
jgi:hypothetical protein